MTYIANSGPESRFTGPREECPYPERWTSDDDDSTEQEVSALVGAFVTGLQPDYVIETGTAWGGTAVCIGVALQFAGQGRLITLEPNPERVAYSRERCGGLPVEVVEMESLNFVPTQPIDFAWFDSLIHLRPLEFRYFREWMTTRTMVGFHDSGPKHGLRPELDLLAAEGLIQPIFLPTPRGVCFARVL